MRFPLIDLRCDSCLKDPKKPSVPVKRVDLERQRNPRRCVGCGAKLDALVLLKSGPQRDWVANNQERPDHSLGPGDAARIIAKAEERTP